MTIDNSHRSGTTEVCITVDVEFSIGGAFDAPNHYKPVGPNSVDCLVEGQPNGLSFILKVLKEYGLKATFFLETLNTHYFGDTLMATYAHEIAKHGHDIQLHLHPCWQIFRHTNWSTHINSHPPNDSMAGRKKEDLINLIAEGINAFDRWGISRPIALRTGGLHIDKNVYSAMNCLGIPLGSNIGIGIYQPDDPKLWLHGGLHRINGVIEIPVLSYEDIKLPGFSHIKSLTITGCSWVETKHLLLQAQKHGNAPVVILTHPSEFIKAKDVQYTSCRTHTINQRRFKRLCRFLAQNQDHFNTTTFSDAKTHWISLATTSDPSYSVPPWAVAHRLFVNRLADLLL